MEIDAISQFYMLRKKADNFLFILDYFYHCFLNIKYL